MAHLTLTLRVRKRWFFRPALVVITLLGISGMVRDRRSSAHVDGVETFQERAVRWLANRAMRIDVV